MVPRAFHLGEAALGSERIEALAEGGLGSRFRWHRKINYLALSNSTYLTNNLLGLVSSQQVLDSGGVQCGTLLTATTNIPWRMSGR